MRSGQVLGVDGEKSAVQVCHVQELVNLLMSITIGDGEKLKHQHHCKKAESAEAEAKAAQAHAEKASKTLRG